MKNVLSESEFISVMRIASSVAADMLIPALKDRFMREVSNVEQRALSRLQLMETTVSGQKASIDSLRSEVQILRVAVETFARQQL